MRSKRNVRRNVSILMAFESGASYKALAARYKLSIKHIVAILHAERHRFAVSPDPFYRELRQRNAARTNGQGR
jgi:Mor family transcriptional regulator